MSILLRFEAEKDKGFSSTRNSSRTQYLAGESHRRGRDTELPGCAPKDLLKKTFLRGNHI